MPALQNFFDTTFATERCMRRPSYRICQIGCSDLFFCCCRFIAFSFDRKGHFVQKNCHTKSTSWGADTTEKTKIEGQRRRQMSKQNETTRRDNSRYGKASRLGLNEWTHVAPELSTFGKESTGESVARFESVLERLVPAWSADGSFCAFKWHVSQDTGFSLVFCVGKTAKFCAMHQMSHSSTQCCSMFRGVRFSLKLFQTQIFALRAFSNKMYFSFSHFAFPLQTMKIWYLHFYTVVTTL